MFKKIFIVITLVLVSLGIFYFVYEMQNSQTIQTTETTVTPSANKENPNIIVYSPKLGDIVTSPLVITGRARNWYFEGSFPVTLYYGEGDGEFVASYVTAKGDWMTDAFVEFQGTIEFPEPNSKEGTLILMKDNPSDIRSLDESIEIKVRFE